MNARIRVLAKQAGLIEYSTDSKLQSAEKFAELIIRECIIALETNKANLTMDAYSDAIWEIKEHFGVE